MQVNCSYLFSNYISVEIYVFAVSLLFSVFIVLYLKAKQLGWLDFLGIGAMVFGGTVNLFTRLTSKCVYDPISFFGLFHFNIFDFFITMGALLMLFSLLKGND